MHMILIDAATHYRYLALLARLAQYGAQTLGYTGLYYLVTVFRCPYNVVLNTVYDFPFVSPSAYSS